MSTATVTLPIEEFMSMKQLLVENDKLVRKLNEDLLAAKSVDPTERVAKLNVLARAALEVVGFAVGNLSPEFMKHWPHEALKTVADSIPALIDHGPLDEENTAELLRFASECKTWEAFRKTNPAKEIPPPFPTEDHPIAQLMMGSRPAVQPGAQLDSPGTRVDTETA